MKINELKKIESYVPLVMLLIYAYANQMIGISRWFSDMFLIIYLVSAFLFELFFIVLQNLHRKSLGRVTVGILEFAVIILLGVNILTSINSIEKQNAFISIIAILVALIVPKRIVNNTVLPKIFMVLTIFLMIGTIINFTNHSFYLLEIIPLFRDNIQQTLRNKLVIENIYFAGFTSQVAFTAFFLIMGGGAAWCFRENNDNKALKIVCLVTTVIGLFLTSKRGPILFFLLVLLLIFFLEARKKEHVYRVGQIILIFVIIYIGLYCLMKSSLEVPGIERIFFTVKALLSGKAMETTGRTVLYKSAINYFVQNPIIGIGWENFHCINERPTHVHNIYLQLLCETGLMGAIIYYTFFIVALYSSIKLYLKYKFDNTKKNLSTWLKYAIFIEIFVLLYGITGNPIYDNEMAIFYYFSIGIVIAINRGEISERV